jgi:hypothetical protein
MLLSRLPSCVIPLVKPPLVHTSRSLVSQRSAAQHDLSHHKSKAASNLGHRSFSQHPPSLKTTLPSSISPLKPTLPVKTRQPSVNEPSAPGLNIFHLIREAKRPVRYTVYGALGVLATVECTFWIKVIQHKFFSPGEDESEDFFKEVGERVKRYRVVWLRAYRRYYSETVWGI